MKYRAMRMGIGVGVLVLACIWWQPGVAQAGEAGYHSTHPCANLSPVLLIHGLNSYPSMWTEGDTDYISLLEDLGYPRDLIGVYEYSGEGSGVDGYNNQGGVEEVAKGMREAVLTLAERSGECGGSGMVSLLAHSMGGLVARQYVSDWPHDSRVIRVISVGTPYLGSWLLDMQGFGLSRDNDRGAVWASLVGSVLRQFNVNIADGAYADLKPGSVLQKKLLRQDPVAQTLFYVMYGDIHAQLSFKMFHFELVSQSYNWGDLVVESISASTLGNQPAAGRFGYSEELVMPMRLAIRLSGGAAQLEAAAMEHLSLRYWHNALLDQKEVQQTIKSLLLPELLMPV